MKVQLRKISLVMILLFCFVSTNSHIISSNGGTASGNQTIENIAIILDSSEFYDSYFIDDVLNGFDLVNQTYGINYTVFQLNNYSSPPNKATYYYNNSLTNLTQMVNKLNATEQYDLIVLMGYELRRNPLNYSQYPTTNFLYYDLSGEKPNKFPKKTEDFPENVALVSFNESHVGFIAGTLAATAISHVPQKIAMIGTYRDSTEIDNPKPDPRSWQLITGFQSGFLRKTTDVEFLISYIDYFWENWTNYDTAIELAEELDSDGYELLFAALQNSNTLGIFDGFSQSVVTVDSDRTFYGRAEPLLSVVKNNTKTILSVFEEFNQSQNGFLAKVFPFGLANNTFYPSGWEDSALVEEIMSEIYTDVVINEITIPTNIKHAENTPGFEIAAILGLVLYLSVRYTRKKKKR